MIPISALGTVDALQSRVRMSARRLEDEAVPILDALGRTLSEGIWAGHDVLVPEWLAAARESALVSSARSVSGVTASVGNGPNGQNRGIRVAHRGDKALEAGSIVSPLTVGVLAALGCATVRVFCRPRVTLLVACPHGREDPVCESVIFAITSEVNACNAVVDSVVTCDDQSSVTRTLIEQDPRDLTLILTDPTSPIVDHFADVGRQLRGTADFAKTTAFHNELTGFAMTRNDLIFLLAGGLASVLLNFELFVRPALLKMQGHEWPNNGETKVRLESAVPRHPELDAYLWARVQLVNEIFRATPLLEPFPSLSSLAGVNAILKIPAAPGTLERGNVVNATLVSPPSRFGMLIP
ncbi:MAG: hypothetical protein HY706_09725 [Candidatus Hydrogenedentes bacterium]|nr:hypothetical protein [Candidatus Hydrogenedentota bacterium]